MFWIGMIVGIVVTLAASFTLFVYCMSASGTSFEEFEDLVEANAAAMMNRESKMQVWHDDECIYETVFEEKK